MKKVILIVFLMSMISIITIFDPWPTSAPAADTIELKFAHFLPPVSARAKSEFDPWVKMIEEKTGGKVKISTFPAGSLLKQNEIYDGVISNIAQIGFADIEQAWGRFPRTEVVSLPMAPWDKNERTADHLIYEMFKQGYIADDYKQVKVLGIFSAPPQLINSTKKPIKTMADLKGLKIALGQKGLSEALEKMGAVPANILAKDHYMALQKGTVDANCFSWVGMAIFKQLEVTKYHNATGFSVGVLGLVMNLETWNSLPADVQNAIDSVSGEWFSKYDADFGTGVAMGLMKLAEKLHHEIFYLSPEEEAKWRAVSKEVWKEWATEIEKKGIPGQELIDAAQKISDEYKTWSLK